MKNQCGFCGQVFDYLQEAIEHLWLCELVPDGVDVLDYINVVEDSEKVK